MEDYARVSVKEDAAEWAAVSFSLESALHRTCHIANDFMKYRVNGEFLPEISAEFDVAKQTLVQEHMHWWNGPPTQRSSAFETPGVRPAAINLSLLALPLSSSNSHGTAIERVDDCVY